MEENISFAKSMSIKKTEKDLITVNEKPMFEGRSVLEEATLWQRTWF